MIILDDKSTWLDDINSLIKLNKSKIIKEIKYESERDRYTTTSNLFYFNYSLNQISEYLSDKEIKCFHSTNLLNTISVYEQGLKVLEFEQQFQNVFDIVKSKIPITIQDEILRFKNEFTSNNANLYGREQYIWFSYLESISKERGCYDLFRYFGGEAIRKVFDYGSIKYSHYLENIGYPSVIEFKINIENTSQTQIECLSKYLLTKYISPKKHHQIFDGNTKKNILPEQIIKIQRVKKSTKWDF